MKWSWRSGGGEGGRHTGTQIPVRLRWWAERELQRSGTLISAGPVSVAAVSSFQEVMRLRLSCDIHPSSHAATKSSYLNIRLFTIVKKKKKKVVSWLDGGLWGFSLCYQSNWTGTRRGLWWINRKLCGQRSSPLPNTSSTSSSWRCPIAAAGQVWAYVTTDTCWCQKTMTSYQGVFRRVKTPRAESAESWRCRGGC